MKYDHMKIYGEWRYRSGHCSPRYYGEVSGQLHAAATLLAGKEPPVPNFEMINVSCLLLHIEPQ
jgi:hypothetical protein